MKSKLLIVFLVLNLHVTAQISDKIARYFGETFKLDSIKTWF